MDNTNNVGTGFGVLAGLYTSVADLINDRIPINPMLGFVTWENVINTATLAIVGGVLGAISSEIVKRLFKKK